MQLMTTIIYCLLSNGQSDRYDRAITDRLRLYVGQHENEWDDYVQNSTHAYSAQAHKSACTTPLSLTLSLESPGSADIVPPTVAGNADGNASLGLQRTILTSIKIMRTRMTISLQRARQRYKINFVLRIKRQPKFYGGDYIYIDNPPVVKEMNSVEDSSRKPEVKKLGPYVIKKSWSSTAQLDEDQIDNVVSID